MKQFYKSLIIFIGIISFQTSLLSMDYTGSVSGRVVGSKFPLTAEAVKAYAATYTPTNDDIKFLRAVEKNNVNAVKEYAERINLQKGSLFVMAIYIATQTNNEPMLTLVKQLQTTQPMARRIE